MIIFFLLILYTINVYDGFIVLTYSKLRNSIYHDEFYGFPVSYQVKVPVYFLLTIVPPHIDRIPEIIKIMSMQTLQPTEIILTIPRIYNRFNQSIILDESEYSDHIRLNVIDYDRGPISKYAGVELLSDESVVIIGDDDQDYSSTFIEDFVSAILSNYDKNYVFTGDIDKSINSDNSNSINGKYGIMGFSGVGGKAQSFKKLPHVVPHKCYLADDVVVTFHLNSMNTKIIRLRKRNRDTKSKYQKDSTSINRFHRESGFRANDDCKNQLCEDSFRESFNLSNTMCENKY